MHLRVILVIITLLSAVGFYNYHNMLSPQIIRAMFMFMVLVCGFVGWRMRTEDSPVVKYPRWLWVLFIAGLIASNFVCPFYHNQSLMATLVASSTVILAYLFLYVLILLRPDPELLAKYLFVIAGLSMIVFFLNFISFPGAIFGEPPSKDLSRGMLRIYIPLLQVILLLFFYSIGKYHTEENKMKWLIIAGGLFVCGVLSLIRQVMAIMAILGFFQLLQKVSWGRKLLLGGLIAVVAWIAYTQIPIFQSMRELSENQIEATTSEEKEDVRIGDWRYYGYDGTEDIIPLLFGNGTPSSTNSVWGRQLDAFMEENNWYMADTSWPACLYQYGYVTTAILLTIIFSAIFQKKSPQKVYLGYFLMAVFLQGIASGVWYYSFEIVVTIVGFYLLYSPQKDYSETEVPHNVVQPLIFTRKFITRF